MSLMPDSTLRVSGVEPLQRPLLGQFLLGSWGHELLAECDG